MSYYGTTTDALTYHAERGNAAWAAATTANQEIALQRASDYLDNNWRGLFQGYKTGGRAQAREWPRDGVLVMDGAKQVELDENTVPVEIEYATYEAALRELAAPGYFNPDVIPGKSKKSVSVSGAVSVEYWSDDMKPVVETIGLILSPLFDETGGMLSGLSGQVVF